MRGVLPDRRAGSRIFMDRNQFLRRLAEMPRISCGATKNNNNNNNKARVGINMRSAKPLRKMTRVHTRSRSYEERVSRKRGPNVELKKKRLVSEFVKRCPDPADTNSVSFFSIPLSRLAASRVKTTTAGSGQRIKSLETRRLFLTLPCCPPGQ